MATIATIKEIGNYTRQRKDEATMNHRNTPPSVGLLQSPEARIAADFESRVALANHTAGRVGAWFAQPRAAVFVGHSAAKRYGQPFCT